MAKKTDTRPTDVKDLYKKLKKRYSDEPVVLSRERKILEHLVFAMFLEKASFAQAREAFIELQRYFIDWNEIRVSTADEIASVVARTTEPKVVGERLRRILQWVFDKIYKFDLEDMRAKGREEVVEFLTSVPYSTRFINDYVSEFAFGGSVVPLDEYSLRVLRLLGLVSVENDVEVAPALKGTFKEIDARAFFFALHELGVELAGKATREDALAFLVSIDPLAAKRSFEPLVKSDQPTDPREIARMIERSKRPQRPTAPFAGETEDDSDEDKSEEEDGIERFINDEGGVPSQPDNSAATKTTKRVRKGSTSLANEELNVSADNTSYVNNDETASKKTSRKRETAKAESVVVVEEKETVENKPAERTPAKPSKASKKEKKAAAKAESETESKAEPNPVKKSKKAEPVEVDDTSAPAKKTKSSAKTSETKTVKKAAKAKKTSDEPAQEAPKKPAKTAASKKSEKASKSDKPTADKAKSTSGAKARKTSSEPPDSSDSDVGKKTVKRSIKKK